MITNETATVTKAQHGLTETRDVLDSSQTVQIFKYCSVLYQPDNYFIGHHSNLFISRSEIRKGHVWKNLIRTHLPSGLKHVCLSVCLSVCLYVCLKPNFGDICLKPKFGWKRTQKAKFGPTFYVFYTVMGKTPQRDCVCKFYTLYARNLRMRIIRLVWTNKNCTVLTFKKYEGGNWNT